MKKIFIVLALALTTQIYILSITNSLPRHRYSLHKLKIKRLITKLNFADKLKVKRRKRITFSSNSNLDQSFGTNGVVETDIAHELGASSRDIIESIAIQSDGKIVAAGESACIKNYFNFGLVRYTTQGKPDTTFGINGAVVSDIGALTKTSKPSTSYSFAESVLIQPDGKIIAGGSLQTTENVFACLARYNNDGTLDTSFGTNNSGAIATNMGAVLGIPGTTSQISDMILTSDGKIIAAGNTRALNNGGTIGLVKYNQDGTLDTTFGTSNSGVVVAPEFSINSNIALQSTGKIIAGGLNNPSDTGIFAITRYNANGTIDNTFGVNGIVTTNFGPGSFVNGIAITPTDNIIACGQFTDSSGKLHYLMAKYNPNGTLDNTFGTAGIIDTILVNQINPLTIALQNDGKIVTGGNNTNLVFCLTRLNPDGTFDSSFGTNGIVQTNFGSPDFNGSVNFLNSILIQSDGKIFAGGWSDAVDFNYDFVVAKYNNNGSLDKTYGGVTLFGVTYKGLLDTNFKTILNISGGGSNSTNDIATLSDGKIIAAGFSDAVDPNYDFTFICYNPDGSQNLAFSIDNIDFGDFTGDTNLNYGTYDILNSIVIQKNDYIVAAGLTNAIGDTFSFGLTRIAGNAGQDSSFGKNGLVITNFGQTLGLDFSQDIANNVILQTDGKIIAGGNTDVNVTGSSQSFALARYKTNGSLDNSFGKLNKGVVSTNIGKTLGVAESIDSINSLALQADNKIIAGGFSTYKNQLGNFALARYNTNGTLDTSFGNKGIVITNFDSSKLNASIINKVIVQNDGKILVGGVSTVKMSNFDPNNPRYNFALARYNANGTLDQTFGNNGLVVTTINSQGNAPTSNDYLSTLVIQDNGTIIAGGSSNATDPNYDFTLVVYNNDGSVNTSIGNNGVIFTDFRAVLGLGSDSQDSINQSAMTIQADGKVLAAGSTNATNSNFDFAIARYIINTAGNCTNAKDVFTKALFAKYEQ